MPRARVKVLVVEDDEIDFRAVERHLSSIQHTGFDVVRAKSFRDAIQALADNDFDIALVDYRLGDGQTGLDFVSAIGGREAAFPVILLTGLEDQQLDAKALETGAYDYLDKFSLTRDFLDRAMGFAIRSHSYERRLRDALDEANEKTELNRRILAIVGHELRSPISSLVSYSDHLLQICTSEEALDSANKIRNTSKYLEDFTRNLSEFVRLDSGAARISSEPLDLAGLLKEAADLFAPKAKHKSIKIETDAAGLRRGEIFGDALRVRQILVNLVKNAVTYSDGGVIRVSAESTDFRFRISVADQGMGMDEAQIESILSGHRDQQSVSKEFDGGLGLGLSICKRLLQLMNGRMEIESTVGKGTTISVEIPFAKREIIEAA